MLGNFGDAIMGAKYRFALQSERGTSFETLWRARASCCEDDGTTWFFSSCGGFLKLQLEIHAFILRDAFQEVYGHRVLINS